MILLIIVAIVRPETGEEVTIPYSCNDLSIIGHELNGIYLVKEKDSDGLS